MKAWFEEHPLPAALVIWAANIVFVLAGSAVLSMLLPNVPGYGRGLSQSLILVLVGVLLVVALLAGFGWWRFAGFTHPHEWRDLRVLWLPILILILPFVRGINPPSRGELVTLIVGYSATAFFEEGLYRGAILGLLRPKGVWASVLISSLLFGLAHLPNIALRGNPALIALQALGAATGGIGLAAIRLRTRSIWPSIGLHAAHDLFLQLGRLPIPLVDAANSIILMLYAIYLLRPSKRIEIEHGSAAQAVGVTA